VQPLAVLDLVSALAVLGAVIVIAALLSGVVDRSGIPQVAIFLALGAALGPAGVAVIEVGLDSQVLRAVATLSLALILFTDALSLDLREAREHRWRSSPSGRGRSSRRRSTPPSPGGSSAWHPPRRRSSARRWPRRIRCC
jgi:hypothetical protein